MKTKFILTLYALILFNSVQAQFSIKAQFGTRQDFYTLKAGAENKVFLSSWQKFQKGNGVDGGAYRNLEVAYGWTKNKIAMRYRLDVFNVGYYYNAANGIRYDESPIETPVNLSILYSRNVLNIDSKFGLLLGTGFGTKQFYNIGYINESSNLVHGGGNLISSDASNGTYYDSKTYLNESTYYVPLELCFSYKYNSLLEFSINTGYNYQLGSPTATTDIEYYNALNPNEKTQVTVYSKNEAYLSFGIGLYLEGISPKTFFR